MVLSSQALTAKPGPRVASAFPAGLVMVSDVRKLPPAPKPTSHFWANAAGAATAVAKNINDRKCFIWSLILDWNPRLIHHPFGNRGRNRSLCNRERDRHSFRHAKRHRDIDLVHADQAGRQAGVEHRQIYPSQGDGRLQGRDGQRVGRRRLAGADRGRSWTQARKVNYQRRIRVAVNWMGGSDEFVVIISDDRGY